MKNEFAKLFTVGEYQVLIQKQPGDLKDAEFEIVYTSYIGGAFANATASFETQKQRDDAFAYASKDTIETLFDAVFSPVIKFTA